MGTFHPLFVVSFRFFPSTDVLIKLCLTSQKNSEHKKKNFIPLKRHLKKKEASLRQFLQAVGQGGGSAVEGVSGIYVANHCTRICINNNVAHARVEKSFVKRRWPQSKAVSFGVMH